MFNVAQYRALGERAKGLMTIYLEQCGGQQVKMWQDRYNTWIAVKALVEAPAEFS